MALYHKQYAAEYNNNDPNLKPSTPDPPKDTWLYSQ